MFRDFSFWLFLFYIIQIDLENYNFFWGFQLPFQIKCVEKSIKSQRIGQKKEMDYTSILIYLQNY